MNDHSVHRVDFKILGMDCAEETAAIESELIPQHGFRNVSFDIINSKMSVEFDDRTSESAIVQAVRRAGLKAEPWIKGPAAPVPDESGPSPSFLAMMVSGVSLLSGFALHSILHGWRAALGVEEGTLSLAAWIPYLLAIMAGGWFVVPKAIHSARRFRLDMNVLMTVAVIGAIIIGQVPEAATVAFLFALSLWLESWSVGRARRAIGALLKLSPEKARVLSPDGSLQTVDAKQVDIGSRIAVQPGDRFPLDGVVVVGETSVNQAPITGESMPVSKRPGDKVFAGTINEDGAVEVTTTKRADDSAIARMISLVADAQQQKSASEQWVEVFARTYTPSVLVFAIMIILLPPIVSLGTWNEWFYKGLVLLVIACPCALVISTPVSVVAAMTSAAHRGILIKGGRFVEVAGTLRALALDKTGTITLGRPTVNEIIPEVSHTKEEVLATAAAIESRSEHPLAKAILIAARDRGVSFQPADDIRTIQGKGMTSKINGNTTWLGSHRFLEERSQETPELHESAERLSALGSSVIVVGKDDHVCGMIAVADPIRPDAKSVIDELHQLNVRPLVLLTGDNRPTAESIAQEAGLDEVRAELLPADKLSALDELINNYRFVGMVGDGVNDAPALARSTLGIAMGAMGSDAAIEAADVALMSDDLSAVPWLIRHSRRTVGVIRQNVFFSLGVKVLFVVLTLAGFASLWGAIAADTGASLLVIANGLRLLRAHP